MIYVDDHGNRHVVTVLSRGGPYAYIELADGTTITVRKVQLHALPQPRQDPLSQPVLPGGKMKLPARFKSPRRPKIT